MKIEIIGTGCHNCIELVLLVAELVRDLGLKGVEIQCTDNVAMRRFQHVIEMVRDRDRSTFALPQSPIISPIDLAVTQLKR